MDCWNMQDTPLSYTSFYISSIVENFPQPVADLYRSFLLFGTNKVQASSCLSLKTSP